MNSAERKGPSSARVCALLVGTVLMVGAMPAPAITVMEVGVNLQQSILNQLNTLKQRYQDEAAYLAQAKHFVEQINHMKQQLVGLRSFMNVSLRMTDEFNRRPIDYGLEQECPGSTGIKAALSDLWGTVKLDYQGDILRQQRETCQRIVMATNERFNQTVDLLQQLRKRDVDLKGIESSRGEVGSSQGALDANQNDIQRFIAGTQQDLDYWQASATAYTNYIEMLKEDQRRLAQAALRGKPSVLGVVTQGVALKAGLEAARHRER